MYNNEIKDKFVELRAGGKSFGDISQELGVVKSTLHRWEDERADDIARLRRIEWEEQEHRWGRNVEELMSDLTCRMLDCEMRLNDFQPRQLSLRDTMALLRESRREYFRLRAMLMGAASRPRSTRKLSTSAIAISPGLSTAAAAPAPSAACAVACDLKSNETERSKENDVTQPRNTNDLQQTEIQSFDSPGVVNLSCCETTDERKGLTFQEAIPSSAPPRLGSSGAPPACPESNETERSNENGATQPRNTNDLQQPDIQSFDFDSLQNQTLSRPFPDQKERGGRSGQPLAQSETDNPQAEASEDFVGSVVVSPYECATGVIIKTLEQETAHRATNSTG
jgi:hypothetical protein